MCLIKLSIWHCRHPGCSVTIARGLERKACPYSDSHHELPDQRCPIRETFIVSTPIRQWLCIDHIQIFRAHYSNDGLAEEYIVEEDGFSHITSANDLINHNYQLYTFGHPHMQPLRHLPVDQVNWVICSHEQNVARVAAWAHDVSRQDIMEPVLQAFPGGNAQVGFRQERMQYYPDQGMQQPHHYFGNEQPRDILPYHPERLQQELLQQQLLYQAYVQQQQQQQDIVDPQILNQQTPGQQLISPRSPAPSSPHSQPDQSDADQQHNQKTLGGLEWQARQREEQAQNNLDWRRRIQDRRDWHRRGTLSRRRSDNSRGRFRRVRRMHQQLQQRRQHRREQQGQ